MENLTRNGKTYSRYTVNITKITNWKTKTKHTKLWKDLPKRAKNHIGLQSYRLQKQKNKK